MKVITKEPEYKHECNQDTPTVFIELGYGITVSSWVNFRDRCISLRYLKDTSCYNLRLKTIPISYCPYCGKKLDHCNLPVEKEHNQ